MMKKLSFVFIGFVTAFLLNQCSPGDVEKESDKIITDLTTKAARQKEAVEQSMAEARFKTYTVGSISNGATASTVIFDNQSGEDALVKLIRSDDETLWLPVRVTNRTQSSVNVVEGRYFMKVRYGALGNYRYIQGSPFEATGGAQTTITLRKAYVGDSTTNAISEGEF